MANLQKYRRVLGDLWLSLALKPQYHSLDRIIEQIGRASSWLALLMSLVQLMVILALFLFQAGNLWLQESILYMNGTLFMLAMAWTYQKDEHVRIDIFYRHFNDRQKALVNLGGIICLLLPFAVFMVWISLPYVIFSWRILEGSREMGGIPALFLLKSVIPLAGFLLILQAVSLALQSTRHLHPSPISN